MLLLGIVGITRDESMDDLDVDSTDFSPSDGKELNQQYDFSPHKGYISEKQDATVRQSYFLTYCCRLNLIYNSYIRQWPLLIC